ncbi:MAG: HAD family phosphatase, partial [bacterium]|nr:HAD family phosphatase [bacterium]
KSDCVHCVLYLISASLTKTSEYAVKVFSVSVKLYERILVKGVHIILMKGAIFDVDGTILDSMNVWYKVTDSFFRLHGLVLTDEKAEAYKEMTLEESLPQINSEFGLGMTFSEIFEDFRALVSVEYADNIQLKPDVDTYLKTLHADGIKIAVATSGYEGMCKSAFRRLGIIDYIDEYAFSSEVGVNKGQPDIYLLAAQRIGAEPEECIVYEDIVLGIETAKKAGFKTCAVYDDTNANETLLLKQISDRYITGWTDLL